MRVTHFVLFLLSATLLISKGQSTSMSEDEDFVKKWRSTLGTLTSTCREAAEVMARGLLGQQTQEEACVALRGDTVKENVMGVCSEGDYEKLVALVCSGSGARTTAIGIVTLLLCALSHLIPHF